MADARWRRATVHRRGKGGERYFGYVEDVGRALLPGHAGPSGGPLPSGHPAAELRCGRVRLAVVAARDFERIEPAFEQLPHSGAPRAARERRRALLVEALAETPLEVMDIHLPPGGFASRRIPARSPVGAWMSVTVGGPAHGLDPPVLIGDPDGEAEDRLHALLRLRRVADDELGRLRKVFSLAHIGDWGDDDDAGGPGPFDPRPPGGDDGAPGPDGIQIVQVIRVASEPTVEEVARHQQSAYLRTEEHEERVHVRLTGW